MDSRPVSEEDLTEQEKIIVDWLEGMYGRRLPVHRYQPSDTAPQPVTAREPDYHYKITDDGTIIRGRSTR